VTLAFQFILAQLAFVPVCQTQIILRNLLLLGLIVQHLPRSLQLLFCEAQFATRRVMSHKTMFEYVISSLSPEIAVEVRDLLLKPPTDASYGRLKEELVKITAASEQLKLQQFIGGEELGDHKPQKLLHRMQQLLGNHLGAPDNSFLKELLIKRLPPHVTVVWLLQTQSPASLS